MPSFTTKFLRPPPPEPGLGIRHFVSGLPLDTDGERSVIYVSPQTLYKFHPEIDDTFATVLTRLPSAHLVLIKGKVEKWTETVHNRLAAACDRMSRLHLGAGTDILFV